MELLKVLKSCDIVYDVLNHAFLSNALHHNDGFFLGEERVFHLLLLDITLPLSDLAEVSRLNFSIRLAVSVILVIVGGGYGLIFITSRWLDVALPVVTFKVTILALSLALALVSSVLVFISRHFLIHVREVISLSNRLINKQTDFIHVLCAILPTHNFLK